MTIPTAPHPAAAPNQAPDPAPPKRSRVAAALGALACALCCAVPLLAAAGVLTGVAAVVLQQALFGVGAGLLLAAAGMWWLHRRRTVRG
jgi:high-affinity Fe2+/Pb2+ permease